MKSTNNSQINRIVSTTICANVQSLPLDLKRMLKVQWKEFINCIEVSQLQLGKTEGSQQPKVAA
jgi:hypothetical protein